MHGMTLGLLVCTLTRGVSSQLHRLFRVLTAPYDEHADLDTYGYAHKRPESAADFALSCSS
jgi:uncharacterized protein YdiU (UPF0061 family)